MFDNRVWSDGYGYRARIGYISPGLMDDSRVYEFYRMAPEGVIVVMAHLGIGELTVNGVKKALANLDRCADLLSRRNVNIIIMGGSPPVVVGGLGSDESIAQRIRERTGLPSTTSQSAAVEALRTLGVKRVAVATPFPDELNAPLKVFLDGAGLEVVRIRGLGRPYSDIHYQPLSESYELARSVFAEADGAQGIYIPGAALPAVANIERLERELRVPVVTSCQAMCWAGLRKVGIADKQEGFGRLFRDH